MDKIISKKTFKDGYFIHIIQVGKDKFKCRLYQKDGNITTQITRVTINRKRTNIGSIMAENQKGIIGEVRKLLKKINNTPSADVTITSEIVNEEEIEEPIALPNKYQRGEILAPKDTNVYDESEIYIVVNEYMTSSNKVKVYVLAIDDEEYSPYTLTGLVFERIDKEKLTEGYNVIGELSKESKECLDSSVKDFERLHKGIKYDIQQIQKAALRSNEDVYNDLNQLIANSKLSKLTKERMYELVMNPSE